MTTYVGQICGYFYMRHLSDRCNRKRQTTDIEGNENII